MGYLAEQESLSKENFRSSRSWQRDGSSMLKCLGFLSESSRKLIEDRYVVSKRLTSF